MAQDGCPAIFAVGKFVEKQVDRDTKGPQGKVANVLGKVEGGEGDAKGQVGKSRLYSSQLMPRLTSHDEG